MDKYYLIYNSPIGKLTLIENEEKLISGIYLNKKPDKDLINSETSLLKKLKKQLEEYFDGKREEFTIPYTQELTPFQKEVYEILEDVTYGYTISYGDIAYLLKRDGVARAVGKALSANKILILVPCHRVVGKNGLGGFSGGVKAKKKLLKIEGSEIVGALWC